MANNRRVKAIIIITRGSRSTAILTGFIDQHLEAITQRGITIDFKCATAENKTTLERKGITQTPTMILGKQLFVGHASIIQALTPARDRKLGPGPSSISDEEAIQREMMREMVNRNDEVDDRELREDELRKKMSEMQARRPKMEGLAKGDRPVPGGRNIRTKGDASQKFDTDNDFLAASRKDNIVHTPTEKTYSDMDGAATLEEYFNREADNYGRKHNKPGWRRPVNA